MSQRRPRKFDWKSAFAAALLACAAIVCCVPGRAESTTAVPYEVGFAKIDITPDYPVRLCGFTGRKTECNEVRQRIFARAMAIRSGDGPLAVLVTVDSIGIPAALREEVVARLAKKRNVSGERIAIAATHGHTTPSLKNVLPTMFGEPIPPDHQIHIDQYTNDLTDRVVQVALAALDDLQPSRLKFGIGQVAFAENRRTKGGPVDHQLPVLAVTGADGKVRGIYVSYACHCVLLRDNKISGDWAGCAAEELETEFPHAIGMVSVGCGADANPATDTEQDQGQVARRYGRDIANEVKRVLQVSTVEVAGSLDCSLATLSLPLQPIKPREYWAEQVKSEFGPDAYYARVQLDRIERGEKLQAEVSYPVQTWRFGKSLAIVFLPGEVVVDYSLRLKRECDPSRVWINAYSNDAPAYIPSERILKEGGYEAGEAMRYYGLPAWFAPGLEDTIVSAVHRQLGVDFTASARRRGTQGVLPLSPEESLKTIGVPDGLRVELVASEPLISSPVALDFGPDGRVWVVEMHDYAQTNDGSAGPPRGRVVVLEDLDHDGKLEHSQVFLDGLSCPTAVTIWRKGVLIGASPDVLYAEDADGDGKADLVKKLYTGFGTQHPQARVNNMSYGLDGWVYAANSFGGTIRCELLGETIELPDGDFRFKPDTGELEPVSGRTEHGRARDDWDNWFGCDNSTLCYHFSLPLQYLKRNPLVGLRSTSTPIADPAAAKLFPRGTITMWPLSGGVGTPTAACGLHLYRDDVLGRQYAGDVFICEPVHQLVHRIELEPHGASFIGHRPNEEQSSEFLTSTDNWFRPVQVRTAPDGSIWIIDMYRYVIEHPRWIPDEVLQTLDVQAGTSSGRIYRVAPRDGKVRVIPQFDKLDANGLVAALDTANGWQRDMAQQQIIWRGDEAAVAPLEKLAKSADRPETRLQALCTLDVLKSLADSLVEASINDPHPGVRRHALRIAEQRLNSSPFLREAVLGMTEDTDSFVALQLACSLGEMKDSDARTAALAKIARQHDNDPYLVTAVLTSVPVASIRKIIAAEVEQGTSTSLLTRYAELAGNSGEQANVEAVLGASQKVIGDSTNDRRFAPLAALLEGIARNKGNARALYSDDTIQKLQAQVAECAEKLDDDSTSAVTRVDCVRVVGYAPTETADRIGILSRLLTAEHATELQNAALDALAHQRQDAVAEVLLDQWANFSPGFRGRVLDVLVSRRNWSRALLETIKNGAIPVTDIDPVHRYMLSREGDADIRRLAKEFFADQTTGKRAAIAQEYARNLPTGDAGRGQDQFQKNCASCHEYRGVGNRIGPDLAGLRDKTHTSLLREILDPNRAVDLRFVQYLVITQEGKTLTGILSDETPNSITLLSPQGKHTTLLRSEIESLTSSGQSLMPEGLETQISVQQMADLLAYLSFESPTAEPLSTATGATVTGK